MTRSLKTFLKAKRWICSKESACLTINMWRCADLQDGNEFCGCGWTWNGFSNIQVTLTWNTANILVTYKWVEYALTITDWVASEVVWSWDEGNSTDANKIKSILDGITWEEWATQEEVAALIKDALN